MSATLIDGKAISAQVRSEVAARVRTLGEHGVTPGLAAVLVGDDEPSKIYVAGKQKASDKLAHAASFPTDLTRLMACIMTTVLR